jgi:arylsulfatase A-like enzyme
VINGEQNPNILMVVFEDMSAKMGAYGDSLAHTPVLDKFAAESIVYEKAFTTAGVCAPSRAALITGRYQQSIGAQHMRTTHPTGPAGPYNAVVPATVKAFPELLRKAGYYTLNTNIDGNAGKTDYQFGEPFTIWDDPNPGHPWRSRDPDKPFFSMVTVMQTHESYLWPIDPPSSHPAGKYFSGRNRAELAGQQIYVAPEDVRVPAYLPDTPEIRKDIAQQYNNISHAERMVEQLLNELEEDGLAENTVVIVTTDHGDGLPRAKRTVYDSGIHVPLMVRLPGAGDAGTRNSELVSFVDFAPTILSWAGADIPAELNGRVFLGEVNTPEREYIYAAMDRHDEQPDRIRAVRDKRYKYLYNHTPDHAFFRSVPFRDALPSMKSFWQAHEAGELNEFQSQYFAPSRAAEELYDTQEDPDEIRNLANDPEYADVLLRMRAAYQAFSANVADWSAMDEVAMVADMWPTGEQPITAPPQFERVGDSLTLLSATEGASIGYRVKGEDNWSLYVDAIAVPAQQIEAKAVRYGYKESQVSVYSPE